MSADAARRWKEAARSVFADPPAEYGAIDGWWWEAGHLDRDRMRWQLEELADKGIAGSWFYARYVYDEPLASDPRYFSDDWWEFTRFAAEEQQRLGLRNFFSVWTQLEFEQDAIRDQREAEPGLWGRRLVIHRARSEGPGPLVLDVSEGDEILDVAAYRADGDAIDHGSRIPLDAEGGRIEWNAPEGGWLLAAVAARPWDLDYLDPEIGKRWVDVVLAEYDRRLPGLMGSGVEGFGPDEMTLLNGLTPYSPGLLERVREQGGFDPEPLLAGLFADIGPETDRIRCRWYAGMCELLDEHFYRATTRWLHERGMTHATISQLGDDALTHTFHYGDIVRYLRTFDIPGNEDPGNAEPGHRRLLQMKISSSSANFGDTGRAVVLAHYCSGWGHTLEENLAWTNEAYANGMNLYSRHLASYSLMGGWYEYVPPSDHFYHPYWRYWRHFADHVRRLSYVLSQGRHRADVALLYPLTTIHAHWVAGRERIDPDAPQRNALAEALDPGVDPGDIGAVFEALEADREQMVRDTFDRPAHDASEGLRSLADALHRGGLDFDVVDADLLARATVRGDVLEIAGVELRCLLLPPMTTIPLAVMELAREFFDAGGTVVAHGRVPDASVENGRGDPRLGELVEHVFGGGESPAGGTGALVEGEAAGVVPAIAGAIVPDVVTSEPGIFHNHRHVDGADAYFLFNTAERERTITATLRVEAHVELWDPLTGETRPADSVRHKDGRTAVDVELGVFGCALLVCTPGAVERAPAPPPATPEPLAVAGPFAFRLEPTLDNRWGDYRHPPSAETLGAEARRFRYREEDGASGSGLGWHEPGLDDSDWEEVLYSHGPYWRHAGPFPAGAELDAELEWRLYTFSQRYGSAEQAVGWPGAEHLLGVSENFLILDGVPEGGGAHHHLLETTVRVEAETSCLFVFGRRRDPDMVSLRAAEREPFAYRVPDGTRLWIDGEEVTLPAAAGAEVSVPVRLSPGAHSVRVRAVAPVLNYAAFVGSHPGEPDAYVPRLRWFPDDAPVSYDAAADRPDPVGWYRFAAPPGVRRIRLGAQAPGVEAWVDGRPVAVRDGEIALEQPAQRGATVALRVRQERGTYAGAVFPEPVAFECGKGEIPLGDWSEHGLAAYSGIGIYRADVELTSEHVAHRVTLDLGRVKTVAEVSVNGRPAGVRIARPFRFDVTDLVAEGSNRIEIKVANTLANHMSTYPTKWVFEGQTVSGLLGPVEVTFTQRNHTRRERIDGEQDRLI